MTNITNKTIADLQDKVYVRRDKAKYIWEMINVICKYLGEETITSDKLYVNHICEDDKIKLLMKIKLGSDLSIFSFNMCYIKVGKPHYELVFKRKAGEAFIEYRTGKWEEYIKSLYEEALKKQYEITKQQEFDDLNSKIQTASNEADKIFE